MSENIRLADQLIDEKLPLDLLPKVVAKKNDMGILKKLVNVISCDTPANYGYTQSSKRLEFQVGANNAENFNDSFIKLTFEVENLGTSEFAYIDGKLVSFFNRVQVKQHNGAELEDLEQANRFFLSNDIQTSSPENCKYQFDNWKNNLVEDDPDAENALKTRLNNVKRALVQGTSYTGILPVSDFCNFFKGNALWHSYRSNDIDFKLYCEEDAYIFSTASVAFASFPAKLKITEAKFHLINYEIDPVIREEVLKLEKIAYGYETYILNSVLLQGGAQSIKWTVGDGYVVGLKMVGRLAAAPTIGELHATTATSSTYSRDLTRGVDLKLSSLQIKCGSEMLQEVPITTKNELYNLTKAYYNQQQDTDIGSLINVYNWDSTIVAPVASDVGQFIVSTDAQHINIPLNTNGKLTGWNCDAHPLEITLTSGVSASTVYFDIYAICSRVAQEQNGKITIFQ